MKKIRTFILVAIGGLLLAMFGAEGQQGNKLTQLEPVKLEPVKNGEYRDLTFWRVLKLGTAPFVNPGLAETAFVAYRYDAELAFEPEYSSYLANLAKAGKVSVAWQTDEGVYHVLTVEEETLEAFKAYRAAEAELLEAISRIQAKGREAYVVSSSKIAFANAEGRPIVSWGKNAASE